MIEDWVGGFIVVPEGFKGERWRRFCDMLREVAHSSSILGVKNRAFVKQIS